MLQNWTDIYHWKSETKDVRLNERFPNFVAGQMKTLFFVIALMIVLSQPAAAFKIKFPNPVKIIKKAAEATAVVVAAPFKGVAEAAKVVAGEQSVGEAIENSVKPYQKAAENTAEVAKDVQQIHNAVSSLKVQAVTKIGGKTLGDAVALGQTPTDAAVSSGTAVVSGAANGLASIKRTEKSRSTLVVFEFEI
jgi:hypothetical protein